MPARCGGFAMAARYCVAPTYEPPNIPTLPFAYGSSAAHSTVSYPSCDSFLNGYQSPSEANRPRTSCAITTYPRAAARSPNPIDPVLSYGVRTSSTGNFPSAFGRQISARSVTPSRIFAASLRCTVTSWFSTAAVRAGATNPAHNATHADAAQANTEGTRAERTHPSVFVFSMDQPPLRNPSCQFTNRASVGRLSQAVKPSRRAALLFLNVEGESTSPLFSFVEEPLLGRSGRRIPLPVTLRQTVILRARLFRQEHPQGVNSQRCA